MKEKIYTIPVNEAFDEGGECPLCTLKNKLESEYVDYALGAAMMEPDYRIISNEKGYCNAHYAMMLPKKEKLSLALVLDTHLDEIIKKLDNMNDKISTCDDKKSGIFKKKEDHIRVLSEKLGSVTDSCVICDKLSYTMDRYISVVFYLWEKDDVFKSKILSCRGFCLEHMKELIDASYEYLNAKKRAEFAKLIYDIELKELQRIKDEVHRFTLKFDYRSRGEKWGSEIDAPKRAAEKLSQYIK